MSGLLESINCQKGITLNSQLVDLLSIIDENSSIEEQNKKIEEYKNKLSNRVNKANELKPRVEKDENGNKVNLGNIKQYYQYIIDETIESTNIIPEYKKEEIKKLYLSKALTLEVCDRSLMLKELAKLDFNEDASKKVNNAIISNMRELDFSAKEGILEMSPDDVRNLHSHMFENGNTYDRVTLDNAGKYSSYVGIDGETFANQRFDKMIEFNERHGMKTKINTLMMYCDFPKVLEKSLDMKVAPGEITEKEKKEKLKNSLFDYVENVSSKYGDRVDTVDIFNELIYDPNMKEEGFDEEKTYHPRHEGWQKYLNIDDLCEMALIARKNMPNTKFTYNDMNWIEPEKRAQIIEIIKQIKEREIQFKKDGRLGKNENLIDNIGLESHLTTGCDIEQIEKTVEDLEGNFPDMPIEVTELDCARFSEQDVSKQQAIFRKFADLAKEGRISFLTIWSQSDRNSFMNDKCGMNVHASVLDDNYSEKDIGIEKEKSDLETGKSQMTPEERKISFLGSKKINTGMSREADKQVFRELRESELLKNSQSNSTHEK